MFYYTNVCVAARYSTKKAYTVKVAVLSGITKNMTSEYNFIGSLFLIFFAYTAIIVEIHDLLFMRKLRLKMAIEDGLEVCEYCGQLYDRTKNKKCKCQR